MIEESLTEEDELWNPDVRETKEEVASRAREVIDMVFENDVEHYCKFSLLVWANRRS